MFSVCLLSASWSCIWVLLTLLTKAHGDKQENNSICTFNLLCPNSMPVYVDALLSHTACASHQLDRWSIFLSSFPQQLCSQSLGPFIFFPEPHWAAPSEKWAKWPTADITTFACVWETRTVCLRICALLRFHVLCFHGFLLSCKIKVNTTQILLVGQN